jgi:hypothetical protein
MNISERIKVIQAYGVALENREYTVGNEGDLPYPMQVIKKAFACEIIEDTGAFPLDLLEGVYSDLGAWTDEDSFNQITAYESHLKNRPTSSTPVAEIKEYARKMQELMQAGNSVESINKRILKENIQAASQLMRFKELREEGFKVDDNFDLNEILNR